MIPNVTTEVALASSPDDASPTWTDISAYVKRCSPTHGRDSELEDFSPGTNTIVLNNTDRRFDPTYAAGPYYGNLHPFRRIRQYVNGPLSGIEFWGDFEAGADGTAPEWTNLNGFLECKAGSESRQLQFKTTPTPRLGARIGRFEVASGDQFGATTGERCEVRRGATNGGFGTGDCEGQIVYYQFSTRWLAPWTALAGEGIFWQMHDSGSTYGAPIFRWRIVPASNTYDFRVVTGIYPNSTDAGNGVNAGTSNTHTGRAFATDQWFDFRHVIYYTTSDAGWYVAQMKTDAESSWTTVASVGGVPTLPSYPGSSATSMFDKQGWYRGTAQAATHVVFHDGYQVGHSWEDVDYTTGITDTRYNGPGWEGREQAALQVGNPSFDVDIVGTASAGGGTTTRTYDTTRSAHGSAGALKCVTNGAASGQGAFHTKRSLSRYVATAGDVISAFCKFSGDGGEEVRIGIEWFDGGGSSISTTFGLNYALRTDFRRWYVTATAPANTASFRIRTSLTGTAAATFWVEDVDFIFGELDHMLFDGYIDRWDTSWPDRLFQSDVTVTATDGFKLLNAVPQPASDPNVEDYESVVNYDEPSFYYRLGEPEGTKVSSHVRKTKRHGKTRKRKFRTVDTRAEVEGVSGPSGTYRSLPVLGEPGAIAGDTDTCVRFDGTSWAKIALDTESTETVSGHRLSVEAWVKLASTTAGQVYVVAGPRKAAAGQLSWALHVNTGLPAFGITDSGSTPFSAVSGSTLTVGNWYHLVGVWNGSSVKLYVNGALDVSAAAPSDLLAPDANDYIGIAGRGGSGIDGWIDEVAIYEKALEPDTILNHYNAGLRGYNQELSGTRIGNALDASGIVCNRNIGTGLRYVLPVRQFGQPSLDPIQEAVSAEGGQSGFFFSAAGVATFLPRNYRDSYPYTVVQATIDEGQSNTIEVEDVGFSHGEEFLYNKVRVSADGGTLQEVSDATTPLGTIYQTFEDSGAPMVSNDDALDEANWLLSRLKSGRWRITGVTFPCDMFELYDKLQQALFRECGDAISVTRRPKGGASFTQVSSIERVAHDIDFEANTWKTTYGLSPIADDLSDGWVLGLPGQMELGSTAVLN